MHNQFRVSLTHVGKNVPDKKCAKIMEGKTAKDRCTDFGQWFKSYFKKHVEKKLSSHRC